VLVTSDAFEDKMMSRVADRKTGDSGNRCFRWVQVKGTYLFHIDVGRADEGHSSWGRFVTTHTDNLLRVVEYYEAMEYKVRVTLQTPFSADEPYRISEVSEIIKGYDENRNEVFEFRCKNGHSYLMPLNAPHKLDDAVTIWP
jgi:hypothetical protein